MYSIKGCEVSVYMKYHIKGYNLLLFRETLYLNTCTESDAAGRNASIHFWSFCLTCLKLTLLKVDKGFVQDIDAFHDHFVS